MALEDLTGSSKYISDLVETNPDGAVDVKGAGDDHLRGVKNVLKNTFPNVDAAVSGTPAELNKLDGLSTTQADLELLAGLAASSAVVLTGDSGATKATFYQNTAPTGWTIDETIDEHSVRLTKGSGAGGQAGGALGGTNDFSTQFANLAEDATPGVGAHQLTIAEMPSHSHAQKGETNGAAAGSARHDNEGGESVNSTGSTGGDGTHSHTVDLRVKWAACIVATKD